MNADDKKSAPKQPTDPQINAPDPGAVEKNKAPEQPSENASPKTGMPDLNALRRPQDFADRAGVKRLIVQVPVTKARKGWFVRTRRGAEWRAQISMIVRKEEGESYVVDPRLAADLPDDVVDFELVTAINRHGLVFLWPLRLPNSSHDSWAHSAIAASEHAETHWVKVAANLKFGAYEVSVATGKLPEPEWPEEDFEALFRLAFRERVIHSIDHPIIQQLKGAA